jgi:hypothetical protein
MDKTPLSPLELARVIAKDHNLYFVQVTEKKGAAWVVYRESPVPGQRGVRLGRRSSVAALLAFIRKLT